MSDTEAIRREQAELERRYGAWTAHNIRLADDVFTMSPQPTGDEVKLRRVTQVVSDLVDGDFDGLRVLDLACLEGMYALEFARRGAQVVAIEGREANLEKARFAARTLGLEVDFRQGDVRELDRASHGEFDVVLCLGIIYHLDHPDVFGFVGQMASVCRRALVVDTHVALQDEDEQEYGDNVYHGHSLFEHEPSSTDEERLQALWSSLDNPSAWAPTRPSPMSLLARSGFTSATSAGSRPSRRRHPTASRSWRSRGPSRRPSSRRRRPPTRRRCPNARRWERASRGAVSGLSGAPRYRGRCAHACGGCSGWRLADTSRPMIRSAPAPRRGWRPRSAS